MEKKEKKAYVAPRICHVEFMVERGFLGSGEGQQLVTFDFLTRSGESTVDGATWNEAANDWNNGDGYFTR